MEKDLEQIARKVHGLRQISRCTGMVTRRTQLELVRYLNDSELATVAERITGLEQSYRNESEIEKGNTNAAAAANIK